MSISPSASSLSPASAHTSPFSSLPNELVHSIIRETVPSYFHSLTYSSRQSTLGSLCLVSKLFHEIAKPLLFAVVHFSDKDGVGKWKEQARENAKYTRDIQMRRKRLDAPENPSDLGKILRLCCNLSTLSIASVTYELDMSLLSSVAHLKSLRLAEVDITASSDMVLPSLNELSLLRIESITPFSTIVNRATLPALRAFAFDCSDAYDHTALLSDLLDHVEAFLLDSSILSKLPQSLADKLKTKTLFDQSIAADRLTTAPFLRANSASSRFLPGSWRLHEISFLISNSSAPFPSLLYLPSSCTTVNLKQEDSALIADIRRMCEISRIEVIFEEQPVSWLLDYRVPGDFWRRMKERKK